MKLTKTDKEYLLKMGHRPDDFQQIELSAGKTKYFLVESNASVEKEERINAKQAQELLGREKYLSGLGRSAYHCTAAQSYDADAPHRYVLFDATAFFRE